MRDITCLQTISICSMNVKKILKFEGLKLLPPPVGTVDPPGGQLNIFTAHFKIIFGFKQSYLYNCLLGLVKAPI